MSVASAINKERLVAQGEVIYQQRLKGHLEPAYHGQIVAIEVESGDYFIGKSVTEAAKKARAKHPQKLFYFVKIGFPAVHVHR
ncbi:MAG: hypothetical protein HYZ72_15680 [Deltaproteobacteria bacterium]|nr:hypothetical protein [Deltaproteobacteria bacterium]